MSDPVRMKKGDLLPEVIATIKDGTGAAKDLTGATAKFIMTEITASTPKVNTTATPDPDQVTNKGKIKYTWTGTDTDTAGRYKAEFEATLAGKKFTAPNDGYIIVIILPDLA